MDEEWRPVVGWGEYYEVSDKGRVRSLERKVPVRAGGLRVQKGKLLKLQPERGYLKIMLRDGDRVKYAHVHRLVAEAFIPNPEGHPWVLHWNDVPSDNQVGNLRWGTASDNLIDSVRNGTHPWSNKTHCPAGHEYAEGNIYWGPNRSGKKPGRSCRTCARTRARAYYREKRKTSTEKGE